MATKYYKVRGGKLSFAEYWRMAPNFFVFCICAGMKLIGGMSFNFSIPRSDELNEIEEEDLPPRVVKMVRQQRKQLESRGYTLKFIHEIPVLEHHRIGIALVFLAQDRRSFAMLMYAKDNQEEQVHVSCVCRFADDTFGATTTQKKMMKPDPTHRGFYHPGISADELVDFHEENMQEWEEEGLGIVTFNDATLREAVLAGEQHHIDYHVERGVYVPMSKAEIRAIREANEDFDDD